MKILSEDLKAVGKYFEDRKNQWVCVDCMIKDLQLKKLNVAESIRVLKEDAGYIFEVSKSSSRMAKLIPCLECGVKTSHYKFIGLCDDRKVRIQFKKSIKDRLKKLYDNTDAFSGQKSGALEIDHKTPHLLKDDEYRYYMSDNELMSEYQLLTPGHNTQKREVCSVCQRTGRRPPFFFAGCCGYYSGNSEYTGTCCGCGWYDGNAWRNASARNQIKKDDNIYDLIKKSNLGIKPLVNFDSWKDFLEEFPELKMKNIPQSVEDEWNKELTLW